jgi:hypothetical protein
VLHYGVVADEVKRFGEVAEVKGFLGRYRGSLLKRGSRWEHAYILCRFFKWLRVINSLNYAYTLSSRLINSLCECLVSLK